MNFINIFKNLFASCFHMPIDLEGINKKLIEILSHDRGYFGRVFTWGQTPSKYEYIGYELTDDFLPILQKMSQEQIKNLMTIINYFEIHANPLKKILEIRQEEQPYKLYSEIAWSHFMTIVMFGMLEVAVRIQPNIKFDKKGFLIDKGNGIKNFLEKYLPQDVKKNIVDRYYVDNLFSYKKPVNFNEVVDHLWNKIRCSFIHDAGIESKGLEWAILEGIGTKEEPITIKSDVPMQEWLQRAWEAILNSYGYKGQLEPSKIKSSFKKQF